METRRNSKWWERPGAQGRQGRIVKVQGREQTIPCPKCDEAPVVYNGNYFCDNWNYPAGKGDCDWALPHPVKGQRNREICDLIGIDYG